MKGHERIMKAFSINEWSKYLLPHRWVNEMFRSLMEGHLEQKLASLRSVNRYTTSGLATRKQVCFSAQIYRQRQTRRHTRNFHIKTNILITKSDDPKWAYSCSAFRIAMNAMRNDFAGRLKEVSKLCIDFENRRIEVELRFQSFNTK